MLMNNQPKEPEEIFMLRNVGKLLDNVLGEKTGEESTV